MNTLVRTVPGFGTNIWQYLCATVAKPHSRDVTGIDKGVIVTVNLSVAGSCLECIRETILEHPAEFWAILEELLHLLYFFQKSSGVSP